MHGCQALLGHGLVREMRPQASSCSGVSSETFADLFHACDCQQFQNKVFFFFPNEADQTLAIGPKCPPDLTVTKHCRKQASAIETPLKYLQGSWLVKWSFPLRTKERDVACVKYLQHITLLSFTFITEASQLSEGAAINLSQKTEYSRQGCVVVESRALGSGCRLPAVGDFGQVT